jgi:hypothetical protein
MKNARENSYPVHHIVLDDFYSTSIKSGKVMTQWGKEKSTRFRSTPLFPRQKIFPPKFLEGERVAGIFAKSRLEVGWGVCVGGGGRGCST